MKLFTAKWRAFIAKKTNKAILFVALPLVFIFFIVQIVIGYHIESTLIEMSFDRGHVISEDGVKALNLFFLREKAALIVLANDPDVRNLSTTIPNSLSQFLLGKRENSPILGVSIINSQGKVAFHLSRNGDSMTGVDLSDREYFNWGRTAQKGEAFIGRPVVSRLGGTKGQNIVTISTPIYTDEGVWNGIVTTAFLLDIVGKDFLTKTNDLNQNTQIWLFDNQGFIWSAPRTDLVGTNIFDQLQPNSFPGSGKISELVRESLQRTQNRFYRWWVPNIDDGHLEQMLVTSSSLNIDNSNFTLAVLMPMSYVEGKYELVHRWHSVMYLLVLGMILLFSIMLIVGIRQVQQISYQKGFVDASKIKKHPKNE